MYFTIANELIAVREILREHANLRIFTFFSAYWFHLPVLIEKYSLSRSKVVSLDVRKYS